MTSRDVLVGTFAYATAVALMVALSLYLATKEYRPMSFFKKATLERALKTLAQALVTVQVVLPVLKQTLDSFGGKLTAAGAMAALSVLTSFVSRYFGDKGTASLVRGGQ